MSFIRWGPKQRTKDCWQAATGNLYVCWKRTTLIQLLSHASPPGYTVMTRNVVPTLLLELCVAISRKAIRLVFSRGEGGGGACIIVVMLTVWDIPFRLTRSSFACSMTRIKLSTKVSSFIIDVCVGWVLTLIIELLPVYFPGSSVNFVWETRDIEQHNKTKSRSSRKEYLSR